MSGNWNQMMQNPRVMMLKKYMAQVLPEKLALYDDILTRVASSLITDNDFKVFAEMINEVLQLGYIKAIEDYRGELQKLDININLLMPHQKNSVGNR
jgi:hypothetical protein